MTRPCALRDCTSGKPGIWSPQIRLYARRGTPPAAMAMSLWICEDCKPGRTVADFISDEGFSQIAAAMLVQGRVVPDRSLTELHWTLVGDQHPFDVAMQDRRERH